MRSSMIVAAIAALVVAGCSEDAPTQQPVQKAAALTPGEYEASWTVTELRSTDKTDPATDLTVGKTGSVKACIGEGPAVDVALFADSNDTCTPTNSYVRGGRMNIQMRCAREDEGGPVMQTMTGTSSADGFEGEISTSTYLAGFGDYSMIRTVSGKRVGDCPAEDSAAPAQ